MKGMTAGLRTWIEVNRTAVLENYQTFRRLLPKHVKLMAVVKSNAYGHGLVEFSKELSTLGADWLGVDSIVEALTLRGNGVKTPILVFGYTLAERVPAAVSNGIALTISSLAQLKSLARKRIGQVKIHLKVDTGMHRQGFLENDRLELFRALKTLRGRIAVEGLYTHFAAAKDPAFPSETKRQMRVFERWAQELRRLGFSPLCHAAATSGAILFPETHFDMVRIGIGLYGLWPSAEVEGFCRGRLRLRPALSWKSVVSEIKDITKGERIGYDLSETLTRKSRIAICPVGYWHGYPRALSSVGMVIISGRYAKVLGRVSMDMIIVDATGIKDVREGNEVILIGSSGKPSMTADKLAFLSGTVNYEIVTRLNPLMRRIYT